MMATLKIEPHLLMSHMRDLTSATASLSADSRQISAGDIFFAYPVGHGTAFRDGREYIAAALANGAAAIIFDPADGVANDYLDHPRCFPVDSLSMEVGKLCAEWYGYPSKALNLIGVTGTNGKTSVTQWLAQALDLPHCRTAVLGTLGAGFPEALRRTGYTTPDAPKLQTQLNELVASGAKQVAMEISSHALDQQRISGLEISCAVFTNLTQDHLDYHGTMADYAETKARLFEHSGLRHAVLNFDDAFGREIAIKLLTNQDCQVWGYATDKDAFAGFEKFGDRLKQTFASEIAMTASGLDAVFTYQGIGAGKVHLAVLGEFNLSNCLAVWTVLLTQGLDVQEASKRMAKLRPVIGRMEVIHLNKSQRTEGPMVVVDYAHTPDALGKALKALRPIANHRGGKIWCVFGCGGDRDAGKRAQMGAAAQAFSDNIVITSDNPRSEDPESIINMVQSGLTSNAKNVQVVVDRAAAIMAAVRHANIHDVILVAGKGHETTQEIKGKKFEFSDQEHIRLAAGGIL